MTDRERQRSLYSDWEYLFAKSVTELPVDGLVAASFGWVLGGVGGGGLRVDKWRMSGTLALLGMTGLHILCYSYKILHFDLYLQIEVTMLIIFCKALNDYYKTVIFQAFSHQF